MNKSRALLLFGFLFLVFILLSAKLITIQIGNHEYYSLVAEKQQNKPEIEKSERGLIKDINGDVLSFTRDNVSFYADKRMMNQKRVTAITKLFSRVFGKDTLYYKEMIENGSRNVYLEKKVNMSQALEVRKTVIEGLKMEEDFSRIYPYGSLASHLLGYVDHKLNGVAGIEKVYDSKLTGTDGYYVFERDVLGRVVSVNDQLSKSAVEGNNIVLTINKNYQKILEEELFAGIEKFGGESAIGIMINPNTGAILGMANYPDYDPANYNLFSSDALRNRILTDTYEPGSTIKSIILSILFDQKLINENEVIDTENGAYSIKRVKISDSHKFESLTVREVLEQSSNVGMSKLVMRINDETLYKYLRNFGFSNLTGIGLPGEAEGMLKKPKNFNLLTKPFLSFGYEISVTPLQIITAYASLVNGGMIYQPFIVNKIENSAGKIIEQNKPTKIRQVISKETSELMKRLMVGVVENGTAKTAQLDDVLIGGKTGTAQKLVDKSYSNKKHSSSFVGFFPADNPNVVCLVLVNSPTVGKYGGLVAAPIFKSIAQRMVDSDPGLVPNRNKIHREKKLTTKLIADINSTPKNKVKTFADLAESQAKPEPRKIYNTNKSLMPDLINQSTRDAVAQLSEIGLAYKIIGVGKVISQSIEAGSKIEPGAVCLLKCEPVLRTNKMSVKK